MKEPIDFFNVEKQFGSVEAYVEAMNAACREYGEEIRAFHRSIGNPIYYEDSEYPGLIVKEMPNGDKFLIESTPDRIDRIIRQI